MLVVDRKIEAYKHMQLATILPWTNNLLGGADHIQGGSIPNVNPHEKTDTCRGTLHWVYISLSPAKFAINTTHHNVFIRDLQGLLCSFHHKGIQWEGTICEPKGGVASGCCHLDLRVINFYNCEKQMYVVLSLQGRVLCSHIIN